MSNYYNKYLKYKKKYLELKGGNICRSKQTVEKCIQDDKCTYSTRKGCIEKTQTNVYIPYFHSCHLNEIKTIPEGSILVNTSSCGFTTAYHDHVENTLRQMFIEKDEKLKDPIANREYIEKKLKFPISIHTSTENSKYLDMSLSYHLLSGFYGRKNRTLQLCSGLYSIDTGFCDLTVRLGQKKIQKLQVVKLFKNSIFPTQEDILSVFGSKEVLSPSVFDSKIIIKFGEFKLSMLIERFPGVYYFMACRPPCDKADFEATKRQRRLSVSELTDNNKKIEKEIFINRYIFEYGSTLYKSSRHKKYFTEIIKDYIENYGYNDFILDLISKVQLKLREEEEKYNTNNVTYTRIKEEEKRTSGKSNLKRIRGEKSEMKKYLQKLAEEIDLYKYIIELLESYAPK